MFGNDARRPAIRLTAVVSAATVTLLALAGTAGAAPATSARGAIAGAGAEGAIPGSFIVVLKAGTPAAGRVTVTSQELVHRYGGAVAATYHSAIPGFHLRAGAAEAARLAADPSVSFVEQDAVADGKALPAGAPAGPITQAKKPVWGLDRIDQRSLPLSKSYTYRPASAVTAYVIDTGVRTSHHEFGGRATSGWDFVDGDAVANDCHGHGTHVAGTIGGSTYGVAKDVRIVALRVLGCDGSGSFSDFIAAVDWVTKNARLPAVANMSLGGPRSKALDAAVERSIDSGVTYTIAAGNENADGCKSSPAAAPDAITVGAVDSADRRASFSNWGPCLDIFAPGVNISSAAKGSDTATRKMSGTSMAAPHVAGAAALVLAAHPGWTPRQVRDDLVAHAGADQVEGVLRGAPGRLLYTGHLL